MPDDLSSTFPCRGWETWDDSTLRYCSLLLDRAPYLQLPQKFLEEAIKYAPSNDNNDKLIMWNRHIELFLRYNVAIDAAAGDIQKVMDRRVAKLEPRSEALLLRLLDPARRSI